MGESPPKTCRDMWVDGGMRVGLFKSLARFLPFDFAPFDKLRAGRTGSLKMTGIEIADKWL
jgi:hypothetical protein